MIKTESISSLRRVFSGNTAYVAALTGMVEEDLAVDTTLNILYRYNGAAWVSISSPLRSKRLNHTRDMTAATGDVAYTGYGFLPKALFIIAVGVYMSSFGFGDSALTESCVSDVGAGGTSTIIEVTMIVHIDEGGGKEQKALLKTLDADGFTLTWTKVGAPTAGNATFAVLALG